ncbi:hypothetical protein RD110_04340 [Rhodoferax koreense]|uniref:Glycosyl transferase n=1 Tax=Rhodoferax koreensis TaxID=1842727 RepID=A0A1P8JS08_9BURK|nr:hypothetical protein [Rhodoferax koreense]APW36529.1 hypothetical protein RD110_04340 [Rhodoferax koreense]
MRALVYLSAVPWASFAQRPHKFAEWFHAMHGGQVLWLDPYPTRLPQAQDFARLRNTAREPAHPQPDWLRVLRVPAAPVEPLPGGVFLNRLLWRGVIDEVKRFARAQPHCELVIGKPSQLACELLKSGFPAHSFTRTVYDAMDDFPFFHRGLSKASVRETERAMARTVEVTLVSSSRLADKFASLSRHVVLARNACDPATLPPVDVLASLREPGLVGYVGTIASWFDWDMVVGLATACPDRAFRLIGPVHGAVPSSLPANIELRPACSHDQAIREMSRFSVGLIPFRLNALTACVDPVKYYEYRALGVPVVSSAFGEMPLHAAADPGVRLATLADWALALDHAAEQRDAAVSIEIFRSRNSWAARFSSALQPSSDSICP